MKQLSVSPARYPVKRSDMVVFQKLSGITTVTETLVSQGVVPSTILVMIIPSENYIGNGPIKIVMASKSSDFLGNWTKCPFKIDTSSLQSCYVTLEGMSFPATPLLGDPAVAEVTRTYCRLQEACGFAS